MGFLLRAIAIFMLLGGLPVAATAAETTAPESDGIAATKFIQDLGDQAVKLIAQKELPQVERESRYHEILRQSFAIPTMARFVLGRAWKTATPEQQTEYLRLFEATVIKIYGDGLTLYNGEGFHAEAARNEHDNDWTVASTIDHPNGAPPTRVDWRVRQHDGAWLVLDVAIEGVSQALAQRAEYASIIQRHDGDLNELLAQMKAHL